MKRILIGLGLAVTLMLPTGLAQASSERITEFAAVSSLSSANVLTVQETITVDYAGVDHHGIYRTIPIIQRSGKDTYYYSFKLQGVSSPSGAPSAVASDAAQGDDEVIKIGDASRTVSGVQTYVIKYTLSPIALDSGADNRVILNVTGQGWEYPIDSATLSLTLPAAPSSEPVCYTGITGSNAQDCSITAVGKTIKVTSDTELAPGEGLTLDARLPSGSFTTYLVPNQAPPLAPTQLAGLILSMIAWITGVIMLALYGWRAWRNQRQKRAQTVYAQYESPDGLKPGEIGLLSDNTSDMTEFTATLIDLAVRGYLKINQTEKSTLGFKSNDYSFDQLKPGSDLTSYEQAVYSLIFRDGMHTEMSTIAERSNAMENQAAIKKMRTDLANDLKARGYYTANSSLLYGLGWTFAFAGIVFGGIGTSGINLFPIVFGLLGVGLVVASAVSLRWVPRLTPEGLAEWAKVDGFKLYLRMAEKDRLNFTDAPERTPERFNKLLPYAVALKVEQEWAKQFDGIDVTPQNGWYAGSNMSSLNSAVFASTFAGSFNSSVNSSFAGSSGAGSAGGGGGGGGGGGW